MLLVWFFYYDDAGIDLSHLLCFSIRKDAIVRTTLLTRQKQRCQCVMSDGESARLGGIPVIRGQLKNSSASGHHHFYLC
jgi:hypothetical protein